MAKASEIEGLDCAGEADFWAAEVLRGRFDEITEFYGAVIDSGDVEAVHEMRVAARRLRSAIRDFAPLLRKHPLKNVGKDLKKLADALGAVRDEDVALIALENLKTKTDHESIKKDIAKLIEERRAKRVEAQNDLTKMLADAPLEDLQKRFRAAVIKAAERKNHAETISFSNAGRAAVIKSLDEFCGLSKHLYAPYQVKKLHDLRIAAKRLRYAIELFAVCLGEKIAPFAAEIAEMQTFLGEVHDADAWIESLSRKLRENDAELLETNLWLLSEFVKTRTKNYRRALKLRRKWQTENFIENLRELLK